MKQLDKYIMGKYLKSFFFTALIFSLIAIVIDFSERVEDFVSEPVTVWQIITQYYLNFIPWINSILWPLFSLISVIFFTSRLANNTEFISMLSAGISFKRIVVPYIYSSLIIASMLFIFNHFVLAPSNKIRRNFEVKYVFKKDEKGQRRDRHFFISADTKVYVKNFNKMDTTGTSFRIEQFENQELISVLKSNIVKWMGGGVWRLTNYQTRDLRNGVFEDHQGETLDTMIQMWPSDFISYLHEETTLTTPEIKKYIANQKGRAIGNTRKYTIEMHKRSADPVSIIILTVIGMALASRKTRGGMGVHLAGGIGIGAMFIFLSRVSATFSMNSDIPESLGIWIPNIIFGIASIWLVYRAQQ